MGEANRKQNRRQLFLQQHPHCIYCGALASTSDHCPPRTFFEGRQWPMSYEFPACEECNSSARFDEQALAILVRSRLDQKPDADLQEWNRLVRGVRNNQPQMIAEWTDVTRNQTKRDLRRVFGREGDQKRYEGWSSANIGPLSQAMISRFMIKLAKSLYYRHNNHIFDGVLYTNHIDIFSRDSTPEFWKNILSKAPAMADVHRNGKSLVDQFLYHFNHSPEHRAMYAVVQFGDQFVFQLMAMPGEMDAAIRAANPAIGLNMIGRHDCSISAPERLALI